MAICEECKNEIKDDAKQCPHCGNKVIDADNIQTVVTKSKRDQKFLIAAIVIILIIVGFTYQAAGSREDLAAQAKFSAPMKEIMQVVTEQSQLDKQFGKPTYTLDAKTKGADISILFPTGPIGSENARVFASVVCRAMVQTYVDKGYMPRALIVNIASRQPKFIDYGSMVYDGNHDVLQWFPAEMSPKK